MVKSNVSFVDMVVLVIIIRKVEDGNLVGLTMMVPPIKKSFISIIEWY